MKFYMFQSDKIRPFILILHKSENENLKEKLKEKCNLLYCNLFENNLIKSNTIILFCILKEYNNKKTFFYQEGIHSSKDFLENLNLKVIENLVFHFLKNYATKYIIEYEDNLLLKEKKENLSFLCNLWM